MQLKNDQFIKIVRNNQYVDIETNKNKSARINCSTLSCHSNKYMLKVDFLELEKDEYLENCFRIENFKD